MKTVNFFIVFFILIQERNTETICITREELESIVNRMVDDKVKEETGALETRIDIKTAVMEARIERRLEAQIIEKNICCKQLENSSSTGTRKQKRFLSNVGTPVGFTACVGVHDLLNLGDKHIILFDKVMGNIGSAYHNHTGIFIAPVKGLYVFHLTAMSSPGKAQWLGITHNGQALSYAYPDSHVTSEYDTSGSQWVLELERGSEVWIQTYSAGEIHGDCYTTFSGFLLFEMDSAGTM